MANLFSGVKDPLIQGTGTLTDYQTTADERFAAEWEGALDQNPLAQGARMARYAIENNARFFGLESNMVTPEAAREELKSRGLEGHLTIPEGGISRVELDSIQYLKQRELSRQAKSAMNQSMFSHLAGFAGGLAGSAIDPINIASAFVPIVPEARLATMLGKAGSSALGRAAVRAQVGATEGAVGALMIEPFTYAMAQYEQMDYTPVDSFMNVVFGGLLGGGLHMAGGAVYDWRATRAMNSLQRGLDAMNMRDMAPDLQDEVQLDILRRFTEAEETGAPLPDADEIIAQRMTPDQKAAVREADDMPGEVPRATRADGQPSQPRGLDELIPEAKSDRTAETFNRQFLDKEQGDVSGFADVRPPREDIFEVAEANFAGRTAHAAKTVPIDQLTGGVSTDPAEIKRVNNLVELMSGPNGYLERLIIDSDGNVIEGQHRLEALRKMGINEVPVIEIRELRAGLPVDQMMDAMQAVRGLHRDQARQIVDNIAEAIADVGSVAEVRAQYAPPRGFERAWEAALDAAELGELKAQSEPVFDPIGGVTKEERARNLARFMGGLPHVKDGADYQGGGAVFDAWHGTTHDITVFKKQGQIDNFLGLGPYFTTSRQDADANYAGEGPDLTLRISREQENIADSFHNDDYDAREMIRDYLESIGSKKDVDDYDLDFLRDQYGDKAIEFAARRAAKGENDGFLMKVYVKLKNPADATGKSAPLTYEVKYDDNGDFVSESGTLLEWIDATREVADEFQAKDDAERYITALLEEGGDVDFKTAFDKAADFFDQVYDPDTGNSLGTGAMFREIAERAGYDGVIMDADRHFGSGRRGFGGASVPGMAGVHPGTLHIVPFKSQNVKSATGNRGTYDPDLADITAQSDIVEDAAGPWSGLTPYNDTLGGKTDVNQPQSPDVIGAEERGLRLLTGVRRSPGILPPSPAWSDTAPLAYLPTTVKIPGVGTVEAQAFPLARKAARDYVESQGRAYDPITTYRKVDTARAGRIAEAFEQMRHEPDNPEVKAAYEAMVKETLAQWEAVKRTGLVVEFIDISKGDPYAASPRLAIEDVRNNNHLWVFSTDDGFGTDGITAKDESDNPLFQIVPGETISGKPVRANDIFRIVHDYFGHIKDGVGFRADGEENAWRSHSRMYSPQAARAMTTETRGQNSWLNYGPYGEKNRTALTQDTIFAEQKIGLLPDWVMWEGLDDLPLPVPAEPRTLADELGFGDLKMMGEPLDPADGPDAPKVIGTDAAGRPVLDFRNSVVSHFTDQESADNINEFGYRVVGDGYYGEAISFTPDRAFGAQFGGVETTARISPDARILNTGVPEDARMIQSVLNNRNLVPNNPRPGMRSWRQEFLRLGIDGVYDPGAGDLFIYNERVVTPTEMEGVVDLKTMLGEPRVAPDTPEFKRWFGGSKVVDADGNPMVMYHGTNADITKFRRRVGDVGIHFGTLGQSTDRIEYLADRGVRTPEGQNIMPVYLSIKRPLRMDDAGMWNADNMDYQLKRLFPQDEAQIKRLKTTKQIREFIQSKGYDGIVYRNTGEVGGGREYSVAQQQARDKLVEAQRARNKPLNQYDKEDQQTAEYIAYQKAYDDYVKFREANAEDSYIAFEPTQIKSAIGNIGTYDPDLADIRAQSDIIDKFQSDLDEQPDLVAAHNLTAANLLHADKMGGIAAPSLAIAKASDGHEGYGEITLIGSKDLVDPQKGANVFAGDIYSARYPTVHYNIKYDSVRKLEKKFREAAADLGYTVSSSLDDDALERNGAKAFQDSTLAMLAYAKEKGIKVEGIVFDKAAWQAEMIEAQRQVKAITDAWDAAIEKEKLDAVAEGREPDIRKFDDQFDGLYREAYRKERAVQMRPERMDGDVKYKLKDKFRNDDGFAEWADAKFAELKAKERIFKGFSNTTGAKMYTPHTLDNVVKLMTRKLRDGEGFNYGIGNLRAKVAPKFRSVEAIRARKGSLVKREEFDAIKKEADAELISIADQLLPKLKYKGNSFGQLDALTQRMAEAIDRNNVKRVLQEYYNNLTDDDVRMVGNFLQKLKTMPTTYFEAKLDRAVQIGEFEAAIVPNTLSKKAREVLERSGVKQIIEYDPSVDGARQAAIDSVRDMKFMMDNDLRNAGFYSALERALTDAPIKKATGKEWRGWLSNRPGIKAEEIEYTGLDDFLTLNQDTPLTRNEVLAHVQDNAIQIVENSFGDDPPLHIDGIEPDPEIAAEYASQLSEIEAEIADALKASGMKRDELKAVSPDGQIVEVRKSNMGNWHTIARNGDWSTTKYATKEEATAVMEAAAKIWDQIGKFQDKVAKETNRARDIRRTILERSLEKVRGSAPRPRDIGPPKWSQYTIAEGVNYREIVFEWANPPDSLKQRPFARSHHERDNVLAHARVVDRKLPDGSMAVHGEELQSDWHQKGRDFGYYKNLSKQDGKRLVEIEAALDKSERAVMDLYDTIAKENGYKSLADFEKQKYAESKRAIDEDPRVKAIFENDNVLIKERDALIAKQVKQPRQVPDAPFKKNWVEVVLKRLILYAAHKGYSELLITPGIIQAERFDLTTHVDAVRIYPLQDDIWEVQGIKNGDVIIDSIEVHRDDLPEHIGKKAAKQILENPTRKFKDTSVNSRSIGEAHELSGPDLRIGGHGMIEFYDGIVVNFLNSFGKKYGAKVGTRRLMVDYNAGGGSKLQQGWDLHRFPIPETLREQAKKGIPLFQSDVVDVNAKDQIKAGPYTYTKMDTERRQRSEALRDAVDGLISKYTGGRADTRWYSSISQKVGGKTHKVDGGFSALRGIIVMALDAGDHLGSAKHEALHFLKDRGLISDVEWDNLVRTALRQGWLDKKYGGSKNTIRQRYAHLPLLDQIEEAIAEEFRAGRYDQFQGYPPAVRAVLVKLRKFFDAVAKEARKIFGMEATAEDIFRAIESGEIGRRADADRAKVEEVAILDAPQRSAPQQMKNQSTPEDDPLRVDRWAADDVAIAAEAYDDSKRKDETLQDIEADTAILGAHLESMRQRGLLSQEDEADLLASNDTARMMEEQAAAYEAAGICEGEE